MIFLRLAQLVPALSGEKRERGGGAGALLVGSREWMEVQKKMREREELLPLSPPRHPLASCTGYSPISSITGLSLGALFWEPEGGEVGGGQGLWPLVMARQTDDQKKKKDEAGSIVSI